MKKTIRKMCCFFIAVLIIIGTFSPVIHAAEVTDEAVLAVTEQLEAIDSLEEIQAKRSEYKVSSNHYDITTTDEAIIAEHEAARTAYETYVSEMFAARVAAQQAYDALTDAQKAQIDPALVAKLDDDLSTVFYTDTYSVTPGDDAYTFEAVDGEFGMAYEVSNHMVSGNIPQTFVLVDTSDGKTSWTPSGRYVYGESNYEVTYCCDVQTGLEYGTDYRRLNLEDSNYYSPSAAKHIRAILQNSYPYVSIAQMKAALKAGGLGSDFVESLTRADIIAAVQLAVWTFANSTSGAEDGLEYFASIDIPKNTGIYFTPLHEYTNECWDWLPGKRQRSYDARAAYRVNTLAYYLCKLPGVAADEDQVIISDVSVTRAELVTGSNDTYNVGLYVHLNAGGSENDNLKITVTSYSENEDGTTTITGRTNQRVGTESGYGMFVRAKYGDTIQVVVEGTQYLPRGVYFYDPKGGRDASQSLVGVGEGSTAVRAEETFSFDSDIEMGLRIYKTEAGTGLPLSDITFTVYSAVPGEGEVLSPVPTEEEIAKYATEENKVGSVVTDATGYAAITLEAGTYLIVEEFNSDKVKAPVNPFYIMVPMQQETVTESESGTVTEVEVIEVVSVYPKNETVEEPDDNPVLPPVPDNVTGKFSVIKYDEVDESILLEGAEFQVYRPATEEDTDTTILTCNGVSYAAVPVTVDGSPLILTTDENGSAISPELTCGTYFLVETKAPDGYNPREDAVSVTVISSALETVEVVRVSNQRGNILPETGGVGTTGFLLTGGILMAAAAVLLVVKRRMNDFA